MNLERLNFFQVLFSHSKYVHFFLFAFFTYKLMISFMHRFFLSHEGTRRVWVASNDQNGPKQSQMLCLGHKYVLFFFLRVFCILTFMYRFFLYHEDTTRVWGACDDQNEPKRRVWRRLGARYVLFFFLRVFCIITNYLHYILGCLPFKGTRRVRVAGDD